jgi:predicted  nucleic acid-binding Zn-ribbon protein
MTTRFVNQITLGNWITIVTIAGAALLAWGGTQSDIRAVRQAADTLREQLQVAAADARETDVRLRGLETSRMSDLAEITALRRDITDLKADLRAVATLLREANQNGRKN